MPTVFSYYEQVEGRPKPIKLLDLWRLSWESKGWTTKVLSESDAREHPGFGAFSDRISRYPTVNPPGYERACYMRHMAMAMHGGGLLVDYDVILRSDDAPKEDSENPLHAVILEPTRVPCAVIGNGDAFGDICDILYAYQFPFGTKHVSDMTILRGTEVPTCPLCVEYLNSGRPVVDDPGDGWKTAPMIHFSTFSFSKIGWRGDKSDLIQRVLDTL